MVGVSMSYLRVLDGKTVELLTLNYIRHPKNISWEWRRTTFFHREPRVDSCGTGYFIWQAPLPSVKKTGHHDNSLVSHVCLFLLEMHKAPDYEHAHWELYSCFETVPGKTNPWQVPVAKLTNISESNNLHFNREIKYDCHGYDSGPSIHSILY